jgi:hypothetical protein
MKKSDKFSPEVPERAVRLVQEHRRFHPSLWAPCVSLVVASPHHADDPRRSDATCKEINIQLSSKSKL